MRTQHVNLFLGFALNNLARTSRRLRGAALNLLEEKGMVLQEWSKVGRGKWKIEFQVCRLLVDMPDSFACAKQTSQLTNGLLVVALDI